MTQLSLFPPPPPTPAQDRIERRFAQWRDAITLVQTLPVELWKVDINRSEKTSEFVVRAVRR